MINDSTYELPKDRCLRNIIRDRDVYQTLPELGKIAVNTQARSFLGKEDAALIAADEKEFSKCFD